MPMPTTKAVTAAGYMTSDCLSEEFSRRRIYITGEICDALAAEVCCQINHLAAVSNEDITLWIMSPGGSVSAGLAILDTMKNCGCDIQTVVMGSAASMAARTHSGVSPKARSKSVCFICRHLPPSDFFAARFAPDTALISPAPGRA